MTCFLVAGERSGDRHGASLIAELRSLVPDVAIHGLGGPEMHALTPSVTDWIEEAGVVGLVEVLRKYPWFRRRFSETLQSINSLKPDAVILIDYPGFNLRLAAALRKSGFSGRIIYYISPQVWAWHRSRIPKMARLLDLMLCIFPFEKALYEGCGLPTIFTGHPLVAWHRARRLPEGRDPLLVGLFPGSRRREITKHFPPLLEAASILARENPSLRFAASAASPALAALMQEFAERHPVPNLTIETGTVHTLMQRAVCGAVAGMPQITPDGCSGGSNRLSFHDCVRHGLTATQHGPALVGGGHGAHALRETQAEPGGLLERQARDALAGHEEVLAIHRADVADWA
jgi:lipid-A-disaccharide synthase